MSRQFIIVSLLILMPSLLFSSLTPVHASPSSGWSWLSIASNGENAYLGSGIRNPEFSPLGFEIGICVTDDTYPFFSFDVLGFKDTSDNISFYAGLGLYSSPNGASELNLAGCGGIWFDFDQFKLGLGYHSARGAELKFGDKF